MRKIGRFCFEDDSYLISSVYPNCVTSCRPFKDTQINSLKHRFLVFLYKHASEETAKTGNPFYIRDFYQYFDDFKSFRLWKMQLLDENHLLLKYASEDVVTLKSSEPNSQFSFFVVYQMCESRILGVYENTSTTLLRLFENFTDCFRNAGVHIESQFTCSPSNNLYARLSHCRYKQKKIPIQFNL